VYDSFEAGARLTRAFNLKPLWGDTRPTPFEPGVYPEMVRKSRLMPGLFQSLSLEGQRVKREQVSK
jgi:hypothetical protein